MRKLLKRHGWSCQGARG
ncbi:hypothetical protein AB0945_36305 [Streptomyces sp. NPDC005474]